MTNPFGVGRRKRRRKRKRKGEEEKEEEEDSVQRGFWVVLTHEMEGERSRAQTKLQSVSLALDMSSWRIFSHS
jgi:hypothetical protein